MIEKLQSLIKTFDIVNIKLALQLIKGFDITSDELLEPWKDIIDIKDCTVDNIHSIPIRKFLLEYNHFKKHDVDPCNKCNHIERIK